MSVFLSHLVLSRFGLVLWIIHINIYIYAFHFISPLLYCLQVHTSSPTTFNLLSFSRISTLPASYIMKTYHFFWGVVFLEVKSGQTSYIFIFNSSVQPSRLILLARPRSIWRFFKSPIIRDPLWASEKIRQVDGKTSYWLFNRDPYNALLTWVV